MSFVTYSEFLFPLI